MFSWLVLKMIWLNHVKTINTCRSRLLALEINYERLSSACIAAKCINWLCQKKINKLEKKYIKKKDTTRGLFYEYLLSCQRNIKPLRKEYHEATEENKNCIKYREQNKKCKLPTSSACHCVASVKWLFDYKLNKQLTTTLKTVCLIFSKTLKAFSICRPYKCQILSESQGQRRTKTDAWMKEKEKKTQRFF